MTEAVRRLVLVLGDQLTLDSPALVGLEAQRDRVLMIEAPGEATGVWSHKARIALVLSGMRHFRDDLREAGFTVDYIALDDCREPTLVGRLARQLQRVRPAVLRVLEPGECPCNKTSPRRRSTRAWRCNGSTPRTSSARASTLRAGRTSTTAVYEWSTSIARCVVGTAS